MILDLTVTAHIQEPANILYFLLEVGPLLMITVSLSSTLFFLWYFAIELQGQRKKQRLWFEKNERLLLQYKDLRHLLEGFGQKITNCGSCSNDKMQLWGFRKGLLVVRCRSCKMNYTFSKGHNELMQPILSRLEGVAKLINILVTYKYYILGKKLARKLAIDRNAIKSDSSPLAIIHFTAGKKNETTSKSVIDIFLNEWQVIYPDRTELLVS